MKNEKNIIREFLQFDEVFFGTLEVFPEIRYHGEYVLKYCLYREDAEIRKPGYPAVIYRPFSRRIKLENGDRLIVFDQNNEGTEKEVLIIIDYENGFSVKGIDINEFSMWFNPGEERKAKLYRKKTIKKLVNSQLKINI